MRFSTALALCVAPLALAGSIQDTVLRRTDHMGEKVEAPKVEAPKVEAPKAEAPKPEASPKEGAKEVIHEAPKPAEAKPGEVIHAGSSSTTVTQVIIIWVNNGGGATTSTMQHASSVAPPPAAAATHSVVVGGSAGLVYVPESIQAAVGDMVIFTFMNANHTVTQSAFTEPCVKLPEGMDSGFMPNPNNTMLPAPQMAMQVTVATPIWFYCRQKAHCGKGMTFSINPTAEKSHAMFQQMAVAQNGTGTLAPIQGGAAAPPAASASAAPPPPAAAAPPAAAPPAAPPAAGAMVPSVGTMQGGSCSCACLCGVSSFPTAAQGINSFGGMSGAMPMAMLEK
ncbi:Cupredoxin [Glarea lozoyensis ATCC 20868]|uniref:Cupredoxin n=1 Tax=Glarea lozoyensis (strain ATCC 20868 / MF5171) TaxID=1116229 RepID=S3DBZ4_GLAL2|nr:Cupredoxin [Glarea lozoyensis ATCC 20868]EPE35947.1 Cupredoxin [Glarea lozoyensis ATCC 20868]